MNTTQQTKLYVKNIVEDLYRSTIGIEKDSKRIVVNLITMFDTSAASLLIKAAENIKGEGIFFVYPYKQFVVRIQLSSNKEKWAMVFYDFKNDIDNALDCYNEQTKNGWEQITKNDFMVAFQEIESNYDKLDFAELITGVL